MTDAQHRNQADELLAPGTPLYQTMADVTTVMYAGWMPVLLIPVLQPKAAQGVREHSRMFGAAKAQPGIEDGVGRVRDTLELVGGIVFAKQDGAEAAHALHELHRKVRGTMPDGTRYHAWNQDSWTWVWASVVKALMDSYEQFRGYGSEAEREQAYLGLVEVGRRFGVRWLPDSFDAFSAYWQEMVDTTLVATPEAAFLLEQLSSKIMKPRSAPWIPTPAWTLLTLPIRRVLRVGTLVCLPAELDDALGVHRTWFDRLELRLHTAFWRLVPRRLSATFTPAYFAIAPRIVTPVWRGRYSRRRLAEQRDRLRAAG